jgi:hypothetical protein
VMGINTAGINRGDLREAALNNSGPAVDLLKPNNRRRVYTPAAIEVVRELARQGRSASEIAAAIGSTAASVRVKCCRLQIKLWRRGRPHSMPTQEDGEQKLTVYMGRAEYVALNRKAAQVQRSPASTWPGAF